MKFSITLKQSGRVLEFDAQADRGKSILDICHDAGINMRAGCRNGYCTACKTQLVAGEVAYLDPSAKSKIAGEILCCSTFPATNIELEA